MAFQILKTEYLKLKGNTSFKVFTIFFLVFLPIIIFTVPTFFKHGMQGLNSYPFLPRDYETTWYFTAYLASWFSLFILAFVLIFHITNEYSYKTVRQNIIDGYSRSDFFKSKLYMLLAIAVIASVYVLLVGLTASWYFQTFSVAQGFDYSSIQQMGGDLSALQDMFNGDSQEMVPVMFMDELWEGSLAIVSYFVQILAYLVFAMFIAFSLKKGATSVIVYIGAFLVEKIIGAQFLSQDLDFISENMPLYSFSKVLPNPELTDLVTGLESVETLNTTYLLMSILYMAIFLVLTRWIFSRRDVV
jgi:ABC-2 type transport system permease protein